MIFDNEIYNTNNFGLIRIIDCSLKSKVLVEFIDTKYQTYAQSSQIVKGSIKDKLKPSLFNIGFIGVGKYEPRKNNFPYYQWLSMIRRCYDSKYHETRPTYKNVTVCKEWHNFQNFAEWFYIYGNYKDGFELDKDLLIENSKIYSKDTSIYVPGWLNKLFNDKQSSNKVLPVGVWDNGKKYFACCSINGRRKFGITRHLVLEARNDYLRMRINYILEKMNHIDFPNKLLKPVEKRLNKMQNEILKNKDKLCQLRLRVQVKV